MGVGLPPRIDEAKAGSLGYFAQAVDNDLFDIPVGLLTRDKRLALHALGRGLAALHTRSRSHSNLSQFRRNVKSVEIDAFRPY